MPLLLLRLLPPQRGRWKHDDTGRLDQPSAPIGTSRLPGPRMGQHSRPVTSGRHIRKLKAAMQSSSTLAKNGTRVAREAPWPLPPLRPYLHLTYPPVHLNLLGILRSFQQQVTFPESELKLDPTCTATLADNVHELTVKVKLVAVTLA